MKNTKDYYLGLDIGTSSVGWAITDKNYKLCKFNDKTMWGVRLFEPANTAATRRVFRASRRRLERRKQRINLLEELFSLEISKLDMGFFQRLRDSALYSEDKSINQKNALFNDNNYTDKDFYKEFPTIYHLRKKLLNSGESDIRLIYLAIHHIIKNRGHFLFEGQDLQSADNIAILIKGLKDISFRLFEIDVQYENLQLLEQELSNSTLNITQKKQLFADIINLADSNDNFSPKEIADIKKSWVALISGAKVKVNNILNTDKYEDIPSISFNEFNETLEDNLIQTLEENDYELIARLKAIYDWAKLREVLGNQEFISYAMVNKYEKHKKDLKILKRLIKNHFPSKYNEVFKSTSKTNNHNYSHYVGMAKIGGKKQQLSNKCSQEDFIKYIKKIILAEDDSVITDKDYIYIIQEINNSTLLPKQVSKDNSVIPHQVHKNELQIILENAAKHHEFFNEEHEGYIIKDMILSLFLYRIPYYVGPVNTFHSEDDRVKGVWAIKKKNEPVRPWNFDEVIDKEASAEQFIIRMTNKCTYLIGEDVLPKHSLLNSKYVVLNELNNLKIDGKADSVSVELKQKIYQNLFKKYKKVTAKRLFDWLVENNFIEKKGRPLDRLSGFDKDFASSLNSYIDFKEILGNRVDSDKEMIEEIIRWITLFDKDSNILMKKLEKYTNRLSREEKKRICKLSYSGWGRFSKELLNGEKLQMPDGRGEIRSIIGHMYDTNNNFMEVCSKFNFQQKINEVNSWVQPEYEIIDYSIVQDLACSPAVKRQIYQSLLIVKELRKVMKKNPDKLFVEMARENISGQDKKRTISRKERLNDLYKSCKMDYPRLAEQLERKTDDQLRSNRLYLYFTQLGKCMYSGETIDIDQLQNILIYDRDHIYPQSKVKDDSLDNLVLVRKDLNAKKSNELVSDEVQEKNKQHWKVLLQKGFISKEKYYRLTRKEPFTDEEFDDFINRQLVETRQSSKLVTSLLRKLLPDTEIVYSKAGNISSFRNDFNIIKTREINDFHHAYDAYLNIVVGNVYNTKFNHNARVYYKRNGNWQYNLTKLFKENLVTAKGIAWSIDKGNKTIALVKRALAQKDVLISRLTYTQKGEFFEQNISKPKKGLVPIKQKAPLNNIERYGGYSGIRPSYFMLIEYKIKDKIVKSLEAIPIYIAEESKNNDKIIATFLEELLGSKEYKVLIDKIKIKSLFKIGNSYISLAGKHDDNRILWHNANQLHLSKTDEEYIKKLFNFKNKSKKFYIKIQDLVIDSFDKIYMDKNIALYDTFIEKLQSKYYKDLNISKDAERLTASRDIFIALPIEQQALQLIEILNYFTCNAALVDLNLIKDSKVGKITTSKKIDTLNLSLINFSVTGLFKQEVVLNEV